MEFNSLDAQREACEAYISSQRQEGWTLVPDYYDDGGISGATLERPALQRLLADIEAGKVDVVVVYKIDRLSRSLMDFARLVDVFDRREVTFVSITQSFNTTTSMGRLTLNILLSFAQFEREVIGERIRDKFAASRRKGLWMGGTVPFGYEVKARKLVFRESEARIVRHIFQRFALLGSASRLVEELDHDGYGNRNGKAFDKGSLYKLINNRVYIGLAVHKGEAFAGEHAPIIDQALWDRVQVMLQESPRVRAMKARRRTPALLRGLIFDADGIALSPGHTRKNGRLYRYYISQNVLKGRTDKGGTENGDEDSGDSAKAGSGSAGHGRAKTASSGGSEGSAKAACGRAKRETAKAVSDSVSDSRAKSGSGGVSEGALGASAGQAERDRNSSVRRVPAGEIEAQVIAEIRQLLQAPEAIAGVWTAIRDQDALDCAHAGKPQSGKLHAGKAHGGRTTNLDASCPTGTLAYRGGDFRPELTEDQVRKALADFDGLWDQLFPLEQHRIVQLLVERVEVAPDELTIRLRVEGFASLLGELVGDAERTAGPEGGSLDRAGVETSLTSGTKGVSKPRKPSQAKNRAHAA